MEKLIMAAQLILGLSILVGVHEFGHLLAAKLFGMRVEKYSIGFPPKIFGFMWRGTEYSLGAIPLGGFVKISGMIDESLDTKSMGEEPKPWEFRAKPAWQRLIVMMGGIIVNIITGILIFVVLTYKYGESYLSKEELNKHGIVAYELGQEIGLRTGDRILKLNGKDFERFSDLKSPDAILGKNSYYTVERNGKVHEIKLPSDFLSRLTEKGAIEQFISFRFPFEIEQVAKKSPAKKAGLLKGDRITQINDTPIAFYDEFEVIKQNALEAGDSSFKLQVDRAGSTLTLNLDVKQEGIFGFYPKILLAYSHSDYSIGEATQKGINKAFLVVWNNMRGLGKIIRGEVNASKALSGPIEIANRLYGGAWDWSHFWNITGLLSMVLAFMNFLPIPALDGGHVAFLTFEMISGRKPSDKFLETAQKIGMILLLALMAFVIVNDVIKAIF